MKAWGITDIGLVRKENQDAFLIREDMPSRHTVCVVCDGMGGAAGGRLASQIAVESFTAELEHILTRDMTPEQLREASSYAVSQANEAIREAARKNEEYRSMGTTLVAAVSYDGGAVMTNVGDSRAYHITKTSITRALGPDADAQCDGYICPMKAGEHLLLCTDGLVNTVTDQEMLFEVLHHSEPETSLACMLDISKSQGASDNVTAVLMRKL